MNLVTEDKSMYKKIIFKYIRVYKKQLSHITYKMILIIGGLIAVKTNLYILAITLIAMIILKVATKYFSKSKKKRKKLQEK